MEKSYELKYHQLEKNNCWFRARRDIIFRLLAEIPKDARALDIGCSGGVLLAELATAGYTHGYGIDISERAIAQCRLAGLDRVTRADAAAGGFPDVFFDAVIASDILEHIADEESALREWWRMLKPGGIALIFVPAHQFLWSEHDIVNHHIKRYSKKELTQALQKNGFILERIGYWNFLLFFLVCGIRLLQRMNPFRKGNPKDQFYDLYPFVNMALFYLLYAENAIIMHGINLPIGVSLFCVARKRF